MNEVSNADPWFDPAGDIKFTNGNLPHRHQELKYQFVTFRLADSLPLVLLSDYKRGISTFLKLNPKPWNESTERRFHNSFGRRIDYYLDQGLGSCIFRDEKFRKLLINTIMWNYPTKCHIDSFVIMPNHVHILLCPKEGVEAEKLVGLMKQFATREINKVTGRQGSLWMKENWDRLVRSEDNLKYYQSYILHNPDTLPRGQYSLYWRGKWLAY